MNAFELAARVLVDDPNLGRMVEVQGAAGPARPVRGAFGNGAMDDGGIVQPVPVLSLTAEDAAGLVDGDTATVDGVTYRLRSPEPDGGGLIRFRLER